MDYGAVRQELANAAAAVVSPAGYPSLETFGFTPDDIPEPCFFPAEVDIDPNNAFGNGWDAARITCRVLVGRGDDKSSQTLLDAYLSRTGTSSVRAAIMAAAGTPGQPALNGAAADLNIERVGGYRFYQVGDAQFFGGEIVVLVIGP